VLRHDRRRQDVIRSDADAENETDRDQPGDAGREGLRNRSDAKDEHIEPVEALATALRQSTESERADDRAEQRRSGERRAFDAAQLGIAEAPENERQDDTDRGEIVAIAENAEAGDQRRAPMERRERLLVQRNEIAFAHPLSLLQPRLS